MEKQFYNFVKEVYDKQLGVEGIAIADGEKILMEHHFTPDQARNIYSHTKSYMSTAVGLAIADGKLSLDDRLAEFFPEAVPENAQPELFEIRLCMSAFLNPSARAFRSGKTVLRDIRSVAAACS